MSRAGETSDGERFAFVPVLGAGRDHKWQPMGWDDGVQKPNRKSGRQERYENNIVHYSTILIQIE